MKAARLGFSALLGACITFALLVLMYSLIESSQTKLDEKPAQKIADIWQPKQEIQDRLRDIKPEKPEEPQQPPPELPQQQDKFDAPENAVSVAVPTLNTNLNIGLGGGFARDSDYIPIYVPQPPYPRRAQTRGIGGYAVVEVTITTAGGTRNPRLLEEYPENYGFGRAALKAAEKLKYNPRVVDGKPEEVPGVLYKFTFQIEK